LSGCVDGKSHECVGSREVEHGVCVDDEDWSGKWNMELFYCGENHSMDERITRLLALKPGERMYSESLSSR
jgi:hypothetical protein